MAVMVVVMENMAVVVVAHGGDGSDSDDDEDADGGVVVQLVQCGSHKTSSVRNEYSKNKFIYIQI